MPVSKSQLERLVEEFSDSCQQRGLKVTHQRLEIFRELASTEEHPDAETIYQRVRDRLPSISRDTVYRTLSTLKEQGLIRRAEALAGPARFDANTQTHHHFICTECGAIKDFQSERLDQLPLPRKVKSFGQVLFAQVQVRGVCNSCRRG